LGGFWRAGCGCLKLFGVGIDFQPWHSVLARDALFDRDSVILADLARIAGLIQAADRFGDLT
jgi:hypothetical protein